MKLVAEPCGWICGLVDERGNRERATIYAKVEAHCRECSLEALLFAHLGQDPDMKSEPASWTH
jgi:hypothetical protein